MPEPKHSTSILHKPFAWVSKIFNKKKRADSASSKRKNKTAKSSEPKKRSRLALIGLGEEKDSFLENLATLLSSGIDILEALESIKSEMRTKIMRQIIEEVRIEVKEGVPIWKALDQTNLLSPHIVSLLRIGEESGQLRESLKIIITQDQKERTFRSKIRSAMMYPVIVLVLALVVGIGIAWFILPRLSGVFTSMGMELPFFTRVLLGVGDFIGEYGAIAVPTFLIFLSIIIYFLFFFPKTKSIGQSILFVLPGIKKLIREVELARLGFILGTLLNSGLPINEATKSLCDTTEFYAYKKLYKFIGESIQEGNSFEKTFKLYPKSRKLIPGPVQQMIMSGERSESLAKILLNIGENFEGKTEITMKNLSIILEPILLFVVWIGVAGVAFAVILPIYSLVGGMNK